MDDIWVGERAKADGLCRQDVAVAIERMSRCYSDVEVGGEVLLNFSRLQLSDVDHVASDDAISISFQRRLPCEDKDSG